MISVTAAPPYGTLLGSNSSRGFKAEASLRQEGRTRGDGTGLREITRSPSAGHFEGLHLQIEFVSSHLRACLYGKYSIGEVVFFFFGTAPYFVYF